MSDVADINRFADAKCFCSYLRSAPRVDSSNQTTRIGRINKQGRILSVNLLIGSIVHFKTYDKFRLFYEKKRNGKSSVKVRIAIVRKVLVAIYHMLKKNEYFYYMDKEFHLYKLKDYNNFLKKVV